MGPSNGGVLITGASTGIGEATALRLGKAGFRVFAGVRKPEDGDRLRAAGVTVVQPLDVTKAEQIEAAVRTVEEALDGTPLNGIVNNAGIGIGGPLEALDLDDFRRTLEVNTTSQLAVAEAVEKALTAKRPKTRYLVGDAYLLIGLKRFLPTRWFDRLLYRMTS